MRRAGITILGCLLVAVMFSPILATLGGHIRHNDGMYVAGRRFRVPFGWYAASSYQGILMTSYPVSIFGDFTNPSIISVDLIRTPPTTNSAKEDAYRNLVSAITLISNHKLIIQEPVREGSGDSEAFCIETKFSVSVNRGTIDCLIGGARWSARFTGDLKKETEFYAVIR